MDIQKPGAAQDRREFDYNLSPDFATTSAPVADLPLCHVRLQLDARYPWLILIPRLEASRDLDDLDASQRATLMEEIAATCTAVRAMADALGRPADKLNVAALGNVTPQLHVHVIARRKDDAAWPAPVWGRGEALAYEPPELGRAIATAAGVLRGA